MEWHRMAVVAGVLGVSTWGRGQAVQATGTAPATVSYHQDREGLDVPHFTIAVSEDGRGTYHAQLAVQKAMPGKINPGESPVESAPAPAIERKFPVTAGTTTKIFELARTAERFHLECAAKMKNIAKTGDKMLRYTGPDGDGECLYDYSESRPVTELTGIFQTMEETLESGRRMDFKKRFDRLGLDAEMIALGKMLEDHQASEVGMIAPTLQAIATDTSLLQRVRGRAEKMLQQADAASHPAAP